MKQLHSITGIAALTALSLTTAAQAATVFTEDFSSGTTLISGTGPITFDGTITGNWHGGDVSTLAGEQLTVTDDRTLGGFIWLDSSSWDHGIVTVEFDVKTGGSASYFEVYYANGVDTVGNNVSLDPQSNLGNLKPIQNGTATLGTLGAKNVLSTVADNQEFTFDFNGEGNIALALYVVNSALSVDNITVTTVPEPGTAALLGGLLALSYVMVRRRR